VDRFDFYERTGWLKSELIILTKEIADIKFPVLLKKIEPIRMRRVQPYKSFRMNFLHFKNRNLWFLPSVYSKIYHSA